MPNKNQKETKKKENPLIAGFKDGMGKLKNTKKEGIISLKAILKIL